MAARKPLSASAKRTIRKWVKEAQDKKTPLSTFVILQRIQRGRLKWPTQRVTIGRLQDELEAMGLFFDDVASSWRTEPVTLEDRARRFLQETKRLRRTPDLWAHDPEGVARDDGYNDAVDDILEGFRRYFPELVPSEAPQ